MCNILLLCMVKKKKYKPDAPKEKLTKPYMVVKKDNFLKIVKNPKMEENYSFNEILTDALMRTNKIVIHTYQFLKLFYLYLSETKISFPEKSISIPSLNVQLIRTIMNTITKKIEGRGNKPLSNSLTRQIKFFYDKYYKHTIAPDDIISRDSLKYILNYEEIDIIKNISTNIKEHFLSHLYFFIKIYFGFDKQIENIKKQKKLDGTTKKNELQKIYTEYLNIYKDVINVDNNILLSHQKYHKTIAFFRKLYIPSKKNFP